MLNSPRLNVDELKEILTYKRKEGDNSDMRSILNMRFAKTTIEKHSMDETDKDLNQEKVKRIKTAKEIETDKDLDVWI